MELSAPLPEAPQAQTSITLPDPPVLRVDAMAPDDAPQLLAIATARGRGGVGINPRMCGVVVRDGEGDVRAYAVMRELPYGVLIDELWEEPSYVGKRALILLYRWAEDTVIAQAVTRGVALSLGGIVELHNTVHAAALESRGYKIVANVYAKTVTPYDV